MGRKIYLRTYLAVGLMASLIFSLGFMLSLIVDNKRIERIERATQLQELNYKSLQFQQLYLNTLSNTTDSCPVFELSLQSSINTLTDSLERMEAYRSSTNFNTENFEELSRTYVLDNLRYWFFARRTKELCGIDLVTVLYFYSEKNCGICSDQGVILTYYKKIFKDRLLIFPINTDIEGTEASVAMIRKRYNVTNYPTIIIEEDKHAGVVQREKLLPIICASFKTRAAECENV